MHVAQFTDEDRAKAAQVRGSGNDLRGRWLAMLKDELVSPAGFLAAAAEIPALRAVRLTIFLESRPGSGYTSARHVLDRLGRITGMGAKAQKLNVGWVVDNRARGRVADFADALEKPSTLWAGFPYAGPLAATSTDVEKGWEW